MEVFWKEVHPMMDPKEGLYSKGGGRTQKSELESIIEMTKSTLFTSP
jgi:hypothetical protein